MIGAQVLVLHLWGGPDLDSNLDRNLAQRSLCLDSAERCDTALAIETLPCQRTDPLSNVLAAIVCDGRCQVALDTEFLALHRQLDEVFAVNRLWGRGAYATCISRTRMELGASTNCARAWSLSAA